MVVLLSPNPESIVHRILSPVFSGYGNFLGVNNTWRFFSPNPNLRILEYDARTYDEESDVSREETHRFPESYEAVGNREGYNRRLNFAMMVSGHFQALDKIMAPLLCKLQPWAQEISIYHLHREFPSVEKANTYGAGRESLSEVRRIHLRDVDCHSEAQ
jgi:hypothetical protein